MKKLLTVAFVALIACSMPALADVGKGNGEVGFDYGSTDYDSDTGLDSVADSGTILTPEVL